MKACRVAAFGFRSLPPREGSAGADKFALELLPRLAALGHSVYAYNRHYPGQQEDEASNYLGVEIRSFSTTALAGFDTFCHSAKSTVDIIFNNTADLVHIQNGGNSLFAVALRLFGKKTVLSQDGLDWGRAKWGPLAKCYLYLMSILSSRIHNEIIFDNIFAQEYFEKRFGKKYQFIPFGADVYYDGSGEGVLERLGLSSGDYFLFIGRFIPDKGLHYLIDAFSQLKTKKRLVLVGGSPNPSPYEGLIKSTSDPRIIFPGFVYGSEAHALMKHCYAYVQPSDVEGLSPVILESAFLGAPIICSDIVQNKFGMDSYARYFSAGSSSDLLEQFIWALDHPTNLEQLGNLGREHVAEKFSWANVVSAHSNLFNSICAI